MCLFGYSFSDKYLYHYTTMEKLLMYILPHKQLRLSSLSKTNDPHEISSRHFNLIDDLNLSNDGESFDNFIPDQEHFSNALKNNIIVLCFAQDDMLLCGVSRLGKGFLKPRMWAQYADNHLGACLFINKAKFIDSFTYNFKNHYSRHRNIIYDDMVSEQKYNAYSLKSSEYTKYSINEIVSNRINEYADIYYFSKHSDWKEENEYRFILEYPSADAYINIEDSLEGIALGIHTDGKLIPTIKLLLNHYSHTPLINRLIYKNEYHIVPCE